MPELGIRKNQFIEDCLKCHGGGNYYDYSHKIHVRNLAKTHNINLLGSGSESVVFEDPKTNKVIAFKHRNCYTPQQAKQLFYLHKIAHTLFPNNFPILHAAFGKDPSKPYHISGTIREKVDGRPLQLDGGHYSLFLELSIRTKLWLRRKFSKYPTFEDIHKECEKWDLPLMYRLDKYEGNFLYTREGKVYYVDMLDDRLTNHELSTLDNILDYMKAKNYSKNDQESVGSAICRLKTIVQQSKQVAV